MAGKAQGKGSLSGARFFHRDASMVEIMLTGAWRDLLASCGLLYEKKPESSIGDLGVISRRYAKRRDRLLLLAIGAAIGAALSCSAMAETITMQPNGSYTVVPNIPLSGTSQLAIDDQRIKVACMRLKLAHDRFAADRELNSDYAAVRELEKCYRSFPSLRD